MRTLFLFLAVLATVAHAQMLAPLVAGTAAPSGGGNCTPASGYAHCGVITVDHTQVGGADISTTFGVLVQTTLGSSRIQSGYGYDVIFTSDSMGTAKIPWEMEAVTQSTGAIIAWVGVSSISSSVNTLFYVSYDNASISTPQNTGSYAPNNVWDTHYLNVYHFAAGGFSDSSSNSVTLNNFNFTTTTGQIDGAVANNWNHGFLYSTGTYATPSSFTVSGWASSTSIANWSPIAAQAGNFALYLTDNEGTGYCKLAITTSGAVTYYVYSATGTVANGTTMHYVVGTYDGTTMKLYVDGSAAYTNTVSVAVNTTATQFIGGNDSNNGASGLYGALDEIRMSNIARSSGWATAEYNNQKSGSTFLSVALY